MSGDGDGILVAVAGPEDREAWRGLRLRSLREDPQAFATTYAEALARDSDEHWARAIAAPGACILATPAGADAPLGKARIVPGEAPGAPASIFSVWVAPEARGTGLGRALVEQCIGWAEDHLPEARLRLVVVETGTAARRLYARCGFGIVGGAAGPGEIVMERRTGRETPAVHLPTALVARYRAVDREHVGAAHLDTAAHLDEIEADARVHGIRTPLDLAVNEEFATLDGNHRIAVALRLGLPEVPVHLTRRPRTPRPAHARPMHEEDLAVLEGALRDVRSRPPTGT